MSTSKKFFQRGFTLIEMLVAVTLSAILLIGIFQMMFRTISSGGRASDLAKLKEEGDYMITAIERIIREGEYCRTASGILYIKKSGSSTEDEITYSATSVTHKKIGAGSPEILTSANVTIDTGLSTITCQKGTTSFDTDTATIVITLSPAGSSSVSETFTTTVTLRNSN